MNISLAGKVALVTGSSSGIGASIAGALARSGAFVACCARRKNKLDAVVAQIREAGGAAEAFETDVMSAESVDATFDAVEAQAGIIDVVVSNAGVVGAVQNFGEYSRAEWDRVMATNLDGVYHVGRRAAERMIRSRRPGSIINIASSASALVAPGHAAYCVSKAACLQLTKAMAIDLIKHRIRVNSISPGMFASEIFTPAVIASKEGQYAVSRIPIGRAAEPAELDGIVVLLASEAGSYSVGANIIVDGGQTIPLGGF